jgi:ABC-type proline/glycine betaine transport system ATPase subunit
MENAFRLAQRLAILDEGKIRAAAASATKTRAWLFAKDVASMGGKNKSSAVSAISG